MAKWKKRLLSTLGFIVLVFVFIVFILFLYRAMLFFFEGEPMNFDNITLSTLFGGDEIKKTESSEPVPPPAPAQDVPAEAPPEAAPATDGYHARVMPNDVLVNAGAHSTFIEKVKAEGATGILVDLKDDTGKIYYNSANAQAAAVGAVVNAVDLAALGAQISAAGLKPIARINTLKDMTAPSTDYANTYILDNDSSSGYSWYDNAIDNGGKKWLNPHTPAARQYICELSAEITAAGFKTIILDTLQMPDRMDSRMGVGSDTAPHQAALKQLYNEVVTATAASGATVLAQFPAQAYVTGNERFGGSPAAIGCAKVALLLEPSALAAAGIANPEAAIKLATGAAIVPVTVGDFGDLAPVYKACGIISDIKS